MITNDIVHQNAEDLRKKELCSTKNTSKITEKITKNMQSKRLSQYDKASNGLKTKTKTQSAKQAIY